jgi:hypothetical protein
MDGGRSRRSRRVNTPRVPRIRPGREPLSPQAYDLHLDDLEDDDSVLCILLRDRGRFLGRLAAVNRPIRRAH